MIRSGDYRLYKHAQIWQRTESGNACLKFGRLRVTTVSSRGVSPLELNMSMTLEEAAAWVYPRDYCPNFDDDLRDLYPDLTEMDRGWAWAAANKASIRQAMLVYITAKPEHLYV